MEEQMRKIGRQMAIVMGIVMSFFLSLVGTLTSGHFTVVGFIISFVVSSLISLVIGFVIPVGKITGALCMKLKLERGSIPTRLFESFISDLIYTPIMTLAMVALAYNMVMRQSGGMAQLSIGKMFLGSLPICFIVGFVLIFILQPLFLKMIMKKNGVGEL